MKAPGLKPWRTLQTGPANKAIRDGWERTFGPSKDEPRRPAWKKYAYRNGRMVEIGPDRKP